jgi:Protein of unknown function (DUF3095)
MTEHDSDFYARLPTISSFSDAVHPENHAPLPDGWMVGFTDVVGSTRAIEQGRYKAVNMVGAGAIAAVSNAIGRRPFPFVFGGDGASFAVRPEDAEAASRALQAIAAYSQRDFDLELRVAIAPVASIRAAGGDVCVGRYEAAPDCVYAMFSGGGLTWLGDKAKAGNYLLPPLADGPLPDLSGLTCRWGLAPARHGLILSAIIAPQGTDPRFAALVDELVALASTLENAGSPVSLQALEPGPAAQAIELEALATTWMGLWPARMRSALLYGINYLFWRLRPTAGGRDMNVYMESLATNADFRKFDDVLYLTLDCSPAFATEFEQRLEAAAAYVRYGTFSQRNALLTCFVLSNENIGRPLRENAHRLAHIHFIDGASGGYAMAAKAMKAAPSPSLPRFAGEAADQRPHPEG